MIKPLQLKILLIAIGVLVLFVSLDFIIPAKAYAISINGTPSVTDLMPKMLENEVYATRWANSSTNVYERLPNGNFATVSYEPTNGDQIYGVRVVDQNFNEVDHYHYYNGDGDTSDLGELGSQLIDLYYDTVNNRFVVASYNEGNYDLNFLDANLNFLHKVSFGFGYFYRDVIVDEYGYTWATFAGGSGALVKIDTNGSTVLQTTASISMDQYNQLVYNSTNDLLYVVIDYLCAGSNDRTAIFDLDGNEQSLFFIDKCSDTGGIRDVSFIDNSFVVIGVDWSLSRYDLNGDFVETIYTHVGSIPGLPDIYENNLSFYYGWTVPGLKSNGEYWIIGTHTTPLEGMPNNWFIIRLDEDLELIDVITTVSPLSRAAAFVPHGDGYLVTSQEMYYLHALDADFNILNSHEIGDAYGIYYPIDMISHPNGKIYVLGQYNGDQNVQVFDQDLNPLFSFAPDSESEGGMAMDYDDEGNIYIGSADDYEVDVYDEDGNHLRAFGSRGSDPGEFEYIQDMVIDRRREILYLNDYENQYVDVFDLDGTYITRFGGEGTDPGEFLEGSSMDIDAAGNLYISDIQRKIITVFNPAHEYLFDIDSTSFNVLNRWPYGKMSIYGKDMIFNNGYRGTIYRLALINGYQVGDLDSSLDLVDSDGDSIETGGSAYSDMSELLRLKTSGGKVLADVDVDMGTERFWEDVSGETNTTSGKAYVANLVDAEGVGSDFDLYVPIPTTGDFQDKVAVCPGAESLTEVTENCAGKIEFSNNQTKSGITATKVTINSQSYWKLAGVTGTGGFVLPAVEEAPDDEEPSEPEVPDTPEEPSPTYTLELISPKGTSIEDKKPELSWSGLATSTEVVKYYIYVDGTKVGEVAYGTDTFTLIEALSVGEHTWYVEAIDKDGNVVVTSDPALFKVVSQNTEPSDGGTKNPPITDAPTFGEQIADAISNLINITNVSNFIDSPSFAAATPAIASIGIVLVTVSAITLGSAMSGLYENLFNKLALAIGSIFHKKKKSWGIVYDIESNKEIAFAVVRLYKGSDLIATTVSDIEGKYGFLSEESGDLRLEVKAKGYKDFSKSLLLFSNGSVEIIENVGMVRDKTNFGFILSFWSHNITSILAFIKVFLFALSVLGFGYSIYLCFTSPILLNFIIAAVYVVLLSLNIFRYYKEKTNVRGRVIDLSLREGISGVAVMLYNASGEQQDIGLTNKFGDVRLRADAGTYSVQALKNGYVMEDLQPGDKSLSIEVYKNGFLAKSIFMHKEKTQDSPV